MGRCLLASRPISLFLCHAVTGGLQGDGACIMSLFGTWQSMANIQTVDHLLEFYNLAASVWRAVVEQLGSPGQDIRLLAALPSMAIIAAVNAAYLPDNQGLTPVQATQVGLVWRLSRRAVAFHSGLNESEFHDTDPWESRSAEAKPTGGTASRGGGSGVKERVLKMNSLIDQADDSELLPPTPNQVSSWTSNFIAIMGALPRKRKNRRRLN